MRARLAAIGAKSISAAVDVTNYVLWDTGQPLHAFDFDKLSAGMLIIRKARSYRIPNIAAHRTAPDFRRTTPNDLIPGRARHVAWPVGRQPLPYRPATRGSPT